MKDKESLLIKPCETIREVLDDRKISVKDFSDMMKMSEKECRELLKGNKRISVEIAVSLERALDVDRSFWINLQKNTDVERERE